MGVSENLGTNNANSSLLSSGYYDGYDDSQQEVVMGAFLTSYTNRSISEKNINPVKNLALPNWSINYNGLKKFPFMKDALKNFVMRHGYSSSVSVSGMQTNLNATFDASGGATARDLNDNFLAGMQVQNVVVSERFSPLIGFDATWNIKGQGLITKFEYKKDRRASLSLNNNQVTEVLGNEWVNSNQATAGQRVISIKSKVDYNLTNNLVIEFYYDQTLNTPKIATSYPTGNLSTGFTLRFNLAGVQ